MSGHYRLVGTWTDSLLRGMSREQQASKSFAKRVYGNQYVLFSAQYKQDTANLQLPALKDVLAESRQQQYVSYLSSRASTKPAFKPVTTAELHAFSSQHTRIFQAMSTCGRHARAVEHVEPRAVRFYPRALPRLSLVEVVPE